MHNRGSQATGVVPWGIFTVSDGRKLSKTVVILVFWQKFQSLSCWAIVRENVCNNSKT